MFRKVLIFFVLLFTFACGSESDTKKEDIVRPAILIEVGQGGAGNFISFPAVITGQKGSELAFTLGGVVKDVLVSAAQDVKKGQVLVTLDQRDFQIRLNSAKAAFENADREYERAKTLLKASAISRSDTEMRKVKREASKSDLDAAVKALEDSVIKAPFEGKVSRVLIEAHQTAQPGKPVIELLKDTNLEVKVNIPAHIIARSKNYKKYEDSIYITLEAASGKKIPVSFKEASLVADPVTQTYELILSFIPPEDLVILPGMNATFWMKDPELYEHKASLSVPLSAVGTENGRQYVWIVDNQTMKVSKRFVVLENGVGKKLNVISGLKEGNTIVKAGVSYLSEGMKVRRWQKR